VSTDISHGGTSPDGDGDAPWRVAVIGAGLMGRGIAEASATAGSDVLLYDSLPAARESALRHIERSLDKAVARGDVSRSTLDDPLARIELRDEFDDGLHACDVVIEAVVEDARVKADVFRELDRLTGPGTLLATNTSALSITEIGAVTSRREEVVGLHFFNPVPRMRLVEIVRGLETSQGTVDRAHAFTAYLGKEPVVIRDSPGFVTTRVNAVIGNEAFNLLMEGVAEARDIDAALKAGLNHPMGPFELVDLVGLDTRLSVLEHMHATLGEKYRPCPLLRQYVAAGRLGRKVGRGVYTYDAGEGERRASDVH
jgi:3-hydroxybutyryl-CoA dehydrogenase